MAYSCISAALRPWPWHAVCCSGAGCADLNLRCRCDALASCLPHLSPSTPSTCRSTPPVASVWSTSPPTRQAGTDGMLPLQLCHPAAPAAACGNTCSPLLHSLQARCSLPQFRPKPAIPPLPPNPHTGGDQLHRWRDVRAEPVRRAGAARRPVPRWDQVLHRAPVLAVRPRNRALCLCGAQSRAGSCLLLQLRHWKRGQVALHAAALSVGPLWRVHHDWAAACPYGRCQLPSVAPHTWTAFLSTLRHLPTPHTASPHQPSTNLLPPTGLPGPDRPCARCVALRERPLRPGAA